MTLCCSPGASVVVLLWFLCSRCVAAYAGGRSGVASSSKGHNAANTERRATLSEHPGTVSFLHHSLPPICLPPRLLPTSFHLLSLGGASGIKAAMGGCDWRRNPLSLALPPTSQGTGGPSNPPRAAIPLMHSYQNATKVVVD